MRIKGRAALPTYVDAPSNRSGMGGHVRASVPNVLPCHSSFSELAATCLCFPLPSSTCAVQPPRAWLIPACTLAKGPARPLPAHAHTGNTAQYKMYAVLYCKAVPRGGA